MVMMIILQKYPTVFKNIKNFLNQTKRMQQTDTKGAQERHWWVGKVIHWELYKTLKFDPTDKWYMYKPESVLGNSFGFWDKTG